MPALTNTSATRGLDFLTGNSTTAPTLPFEIRLMSANGDADTPGTELVGGSYTPQPITLTAAVIVNNVAESYNNALIRFDDSPAGPVAGAEIYDALDVRWFWGPLDNPRTLEDGDPVEYAASTVVVRNS